VRSVGTISSASLSVSDTGMPEFVNRIYVLWSVQVKGGRKQRRTPGVRLVCQASLIFLRGAESSTTSRSV